MPEGKHMYVYRQERERDYQQTISKIENSRNRSTVKLYRNMDINARKKPAKKV